MKNYPDCFILNIVFSINFYMLFQQNVIRNALVDVSLKAVENAILAAQQDGR